MRRAAIENGMKRKGKENGRGMLQREGHAA